MVVSMYNQVDEGLGPGTGNWHRMLSVAEFIRFYILTLIIAADANESAEDIHRSGWPKCMFGIVSHVHSGTFRSAKGNWSTIDLFVLSIVLSATADPAGGGSPVRSPNRTSLSPFGWRPPPKNTGKGF